LLATGRKEKGFSTGVPVFIAALTGIRAIAAYLVFFHHYGIPSPDSLKDAFKSFALECHVGVVFFFVLSGFVITYRNFESSNMEKGWLLQYARNRVARIYPVYFLLMLLLFWASWNPTLTGISLDNWIPFNVHDSFEMWTNFTLTKSFFNQLKFTGYPQAWSLTVEECFYFSAPLIFWAIRKRKWWIPVLTIPLLGTCLILFAPHPRGFVNNWVFALTYTYFGTFIEFFIGMALALLILKFRDNPEKLRFTRWPVYTYLGLLGSFGTIVVMSCLSVDPSISLQVNLITVAWFSPWGLVLDGLILPLCLFVFYGGLVVEKSLIQKLLSSPLMVLLGQSSYSFYLIQQGIVMGFISYKLTSDWYGAFTWTIIFSILIYKWIEEPLNRLIRGKKSPVLQVVNSTSSQISEQSA